MKYMLDTNICIYIIKKHPAKVLHKFESFEIGELCLSSVTVAELIYGAEKSQQHHKNKNALTQFLLPFDIMPFDEDAAEHYGKIRASLEKKDMPIGALDTMIAAHAQCLHMTLVTNNSKEFTRVPDLKLEDWVHVH